MEEFIQFTFIYVHLWEVYAIQIFATEYVLMITIMAPMPFRNQLGIAH